MTTPPRQTASLPEMVARKREPVSYALIAVGVLLVALTIFWAMRWNSGRNQPAPKVDETSQEAPAPLPTDKGDYLLAAIWSGLLALLTLASAGWLLTRSPGLANFVSEIRLWLIVLGGCAGLVTTLLGFALLWRWQPSLLRWINESETGEAKWALAGLTVFLAGLALAFISVQLARAEERTNVRLRRLLYGTNAVITGLLMLLVLAVVNVIAFVKLPDSVITTAAAFKGLSDPSKEFLRTINEDVEVYLILPENYPIPIQDPQTPGQPKAYTALYTDCRALMNAVHAANSRIKVKALSPATDDDEINALMKRLKLPDEQKKRFGMLVVYGKDETLHSFIGARELLAPGEQGPVFQGENRLLTELNFLSGGAKRPVVYFTQSNGEPPIENIGPGDPNVGIVSAIVQHLKDRKYEVKPLSFEEGKKPNLADADIVVVACPREPFDIWQEAILREYLLPKGGGTGGKLVALLPAFPEIKTEQVSRTGLEDLLADFGVKVEPKLRVFSFPRPDFKPTWVLGVCAPDGLRHGNPLARLLDEDSLVPFDDVRPVSAMPTRQGTGLVSFNLFETRDRWLTYRDNKYRSNPRDVVEQLRKEQNVRKEQNDKTKGTQAEKLVTANPVPFGVYVGERVPEGDGFKDRPRLVVIGCDWFLRDRDIRGTPAPVEYVDLTGKLMEYVRERPQGMNIEPRALGAYTLPKDPDGVSLLLLPIALVVFGILGLGVGVWVARRK